MKPPGRLLAASAQMSGGALAVALTVARGGRRRVERFVCGAVDGMALGTMLQLAVARGPQRITSNESRAIHR